MGFVVAWDWSRALWYLLCCVVFVVSAADLDEEVCNVTIAAPDPYFVQYNEPLVLNCSTTCNSTASLEWETSLQKQQQTPETPAVLRSIMNQWITVPNCFILISESNIPKDRTTIIAYVPPEEVIIGIPLVMAVGKSHVIHCEVRNVAPKKYLTLFIKRGNETLYMETYADDHSNSSTDVTLNHSMTAQREDNGANYTCLAQLDLRPNGEVFEKSSMQSIHTYALPKEIEITVPAQIEEGSEVTVQCHATEAFPVEEMRLELTLEDMRLNIAETLNVTEMWMHTDMLAVKAVVPTLEGGTYMLTCRAKIGELSSGTTTQEFLVYSFPDPVFNIEGILSADTDVILNCTAPAVSPEKILVTIEIDGTHVCNGTSSLLCSYRAQKEHNGMKITCEVTQEDTNISKRISKTLSITYAPEINNIICPTTQTLVEGRDTALICRAEGNPTPSVECTKDGSMDIWQNIDRNSSGSFNCTATNSINSVFQLVTVSVEYKPTVTLELEGPENIRKGDNLTLKCQADGLPTPTYSWLLPTEANIIYSMDNETITILEAKSQNSGNYICEVINQHGRDSQQKQIHVSDLLPIILGAVLGSAAVLAGIAAGVAYYLYQRATKIQKYELQKSKQKAKQSTNSGKPIPPKNKTSTV